MTSSIATNQDGKHVDVKESKTVTTIHRIYKGNPDDIVLRDPNNRRSFINKPAYAKLHRSFSSGNKRYSVDGLKGRFESLAKQNEPEHIQKKEAEFAETKKEDKKVETSSDDEKAQFSPASFGYPKTAKLVPPIIKPKPPVRKRPPKDVNSNVVKRKSVSSDGDEIRSIILQPSASEESVDKIAKELSSFTMDGKPKDKKRSSFRKLLLGGLFGKDKKKKEDDRNKQKAGDNIVYTDNIRNESNFIRESPVRQTVPAKIEDPYGRRPNEIRMQEYHERKIRELELEYAQLHVDRFNSIRQNFNENRNENYVIMEKPKPCITDSISTPVNKYIDTSSSTSTESEKPLSVNTRDTPPRAQETYQNITVVKPKATIPINSERPLPNPYQNNQDVPRTIERNLNKTDSKDYPDKASFTPTQEETYGTVFDNLEYTSRNGDTKPVNHRPLSSPKPLSLESTKLKLSPNREIYEPQPRMKSPIPSNKVSTDRIIATELLKNTTRSPTPLNLTLQRSSENVVAAKPPVSPKSPNKPEHHVDRIVTNAVVHAPQRSQTSLDNRMYNNVNTRPTTPVDLRMSVSMKMSPKKEDVRKSIEEYYWKQLKKLKEEEDQKLQEIQMNGYYDEQTRLRRSRSLSPSTHRAGRRSLSLPRDNRAQNYVEYGRMQPQQPIPENQALTVTDGRDNRYFVYDQHFTRNNPERRTVDSLQRPIFRRGSLSKQEIYETSPYNKRVSFSSSHSPQQAWPTRNGYTSNPPQRRLDRMDSDLDDEVFVQVEPVYNPKYIPQQEPMYSNRVLEQFRAQQYDKMRSQQLYGQVPPQMGDRRLSMDSLARQQDIYGSHAPPPQVVRRMSNVPQFEDYGRPNIQRYPSNTQLPLQRNPVYFSRQSITDSNYGQKQVTMRNKVCDIYGQIHDVPQSGIVMGQLQSPPTVPPHQPENFVRGSRLTASANDIGKRQADPRMVYDPIYTRKRENNYENRPLPPLPRQSIRNTQVSDTESGSDASEIQRIINTKNKKRGFFGK